MSPKILVLDESRVDRTESCWNWTGPVDGFGYGMTYQSATRGSMRAHIVSYRLHRGDVPKGLVVRHGCDNPSCVNPEHLELGTRADNNRDRDERGRHWSPSGVAHHAAKLTPETVAEIRAIPRHTKGFARGMAEKFGVSIGHIYQVRSASAGIWRNVK